VAGIILTVIGGLAFLSLIIAMVSAVFSDFHRG
jgi:hypothetical protein